MTKEDEELNTNISSFFTDSEKYADPKEPSTVHIKISKLTSSVKIFLSR